MILKNYLCVSSCVRMAKVEKHRDEVVVNSGWRVWGGVGSWNTERAGMETKVKECERGRLICLSVGIHLSISFISLSSVCLASLVVLKHVLILRTLIKGRRKEKKPLLNAVFFFALLLI